MADEQEAKTTETVRVSKHELESIREEMKVLTDFKKKYDADNEPAHLRIKGKKTKFHTAFLAHHKLGDNDEALFPVVSVGNAYKNSKSTSEIDDQLLPILYLDEAMEMKKDIVPLWGFLRDAPRFLVKIVKQVKEMREEFDPKTGGGGIAEKQGKITGSNFQGLNGSVPDGFTDSPTGQDLELGVTYMDTMTTIEFLQGPFAGKTFTLPKNDDSALNV